MDAKIESPSRALRELVAIEEIVWRIEQIAKVSVIILDACRDSPLAERLRRVAIVENRQAILPRGLPPITVQGSNSLLVYAAAPGEVAKDGVGERNSPFTAALLKHIETPGLEIQSVFTRVTKDVLQTTKGGQQPERLSKLQTEVVFLSSASFSATTSSTGVTLQVLATDFRTIPIDLSISQAAKGCRRKHR